MNRALAPLLLALTLAAPTLAAAQESHGEPEVQERVLLSGVGWLTAAAGQRELPFTISERGPLVALAPVVELLGGRLDVGPLGQGHTLQVSTEEVVLGPDSTVMTSGDQITPLSQAPRIGDGGLQVPIDLLERTFGSYLGFDFRWSEEERRLIVTRRPQRVLRMEVDSMNFQGVSTLVLKFADVPRYRVDRQGNVIVVEVLGDRLIAGRVEVEEDPLVRRLDIDGSRVRIELEPEASAADPYVVRRAPWYQLVFDVSRQRQAGPATADPARPAPRRSGELKIVIDPGHGGSERGAVGPSGSEEKDLTLLLARTLKRNLERRLAARVVLTRNEDADLPHETRTAIANQNQADLFVSLHLNSELGSAARGAETYFLSMQASDARAAAAVAFENQGRSPAPGPAPSDDEYGLQLILWDLAQSHHLAESQRLANLIQQELNETLKLRDRGVKQAPFRVLMGATMPAVLIELGFLSNAEEEAKLQSASYRSELVDALVRAVLRYRAQTSSPGSRALP